MTDINEMLEQYAKQAEETARLAELDGNTELQQKALALASAWRALKEHQR